MKQEKKMKKKYFQIKIKKLITQKKLKLLLIRKLGGLRVKSLLDTVIGKRMEDAVILIKMEDSLKTEIIIKSVTKIAQQDGIPVFVVKKGDPDSGIILIKIDLLNGKGQLIRRNYSYSLKK